MAPTHASDDRFNDRTDAVSSAHQGLRRHSFIAAADGAAFATASIGRAGAMNRELPLGGPDAVSWREVVNAFERVLSREIGVVSIPPGQPLPGLPDNVPSLMAGLDTYDSVIPMADIARTFGVTHTTVDAFVTGMLADTKQR